MRRDYTESELRALILDWLERHGRWGAHYFPLDTLVNKLSHAVKNDGKRIRRTVKELREEGYVFAHKGGETISLNPTRSREIVEYIRKVMKV
jgi:DNA-binding transcriptional ArsR family regulator